MELRLRAGESALIQIIQHQYLILAFQPDRPGGDIVGNLLREVALDRSGIALFHRLEFCHRLKESDCAGVAGDDRPRRRY